jgi:hypothetical protein
MSDKQLTPSRANPYEGMTGPELDQEYTDRLQDLSDAIATEIPSKEELLRWAMENHPDVLEAERELNGLDRKLILIEEVRSGDFDRG